MIESDIFVRSRHGAPTVCWHETSVGTAVRFRDARPSVSGSAACQRGGYTRPERLCFRRLVQDP